MSDINSKPFKSIRKLGRKYFLKVSIFFIFCSSLLILGIDYLVHDKFEYSLSRSLFLDVLFENRFLILSLAIISLISFKIINSLFDKLILRDISGLSSKIKSSKVLEIINWKNNSNLSYETEIDIIHNKIKQLTNEKIDLERRNRELSETLEIQESHFNLKIHEQVEKETIALKNSLEKIESISSAKSNFLSNFTNDLKSPISTIKMACNLLKEGYKEDYVDTIVNSSDSLSLVISDILDFSKIENESIELDRGSFNLREMVESTFKKYKMQFYQKDINYKLKMSESVPEYIDSDGSKIRQVLSNLISNALKYTEIGSVDVVVDLLDEIYIRMEIIDTGIGIPKNKLDEIFKTFSNEQDVSEKIYGSAGLGLAISKELSILLGGGIGVESDFGGGSSFVFIFEFDEGQSDNKVNLVSEESTNQYDISVLIVDDIPEVLEVTASLISQMVSNVETAIDGTDAIMKARSGHYDLIMMDLSMPEMNGYDATMIIKDCGLAYDPVIVAYTGSPKEEVMGRSTYFDEIIPKPLFLDDFLKILEKFGLGKKTNSNKKVS